MIKIKNQRQTESGWKFLVEAGEGEDVIQYSVTLDTEYWQKLTSGKGDPSELVQRSFEFLLEREPKESILINFNIQVISKYFPDYESSLRSSMQDVK